MRNFARRGIASLVIAVLVGSFAVAGSGSVGAVTSARADDASATSVTSQQTSYGNVLFTAEGKALYVLSFDTPGTATTPAKSSCTGRCVGAWPPLLVSGTFGPFAVSGDVQRVGLGVFQRADGTFQATYFGRPLYTFINDKTAGQTSGQNVGAFNGLWNLMTVSGQIDAGVATVSTESTSFGTVLSAPTAFSTYRSLYDLTSDGPNVTSCYGGCARFWPPLLTTGAPVAGAGVTPSGLGTTRRADGTMQVTYFGIPLYMFALDLGAGAKSGLTNGEDVAVPPDGMWYLISPLGVSVPGQATMATVPSSLGTVLGYNPSGDPKSPAYPVYMFTGDTAKTSACTGFCTRFWAPVLTTGAAQALAGSGVNSAWLGTIQRPDGTTQVTYNGHPLYNFSHDFSTTGQGISSFGGTFWLMQSSGAPSQTMLASRPVISIPELSTSSLGISASFVVAFTSKASGQSMVLFGPGPGCAGLIETGTQDAGAGTTNHLVTVTGNDLAGSAGDIGIQPGATYSFEVVTTGNAGTEKDDNKGACYTVAIPAS